LPVNFLTAWYALHSIVPTVTGKQAVVTGASGGVGGQLVRMLKEKGYVVTAVAGSVEKEAYCRKQDADFFILREDYYKRPPQADVVFLNDGVYSRKLLRQGVFSGGQLIVYGFHSLVQRKSSYLKMFFQYIRMSSISPFFDIAENKTVTGFNIINFDERHLLFNEAKVELTKCIDSLVSNSVSVNLFPISEVSKALEVLYEGVNSGKCVIEVG
jgi:NADPH:quinone reductase-like Zn-dependent oxidoreductase